MHKDYYPPQTDYTLVDGVKHLKVIGPYYNSDKGLTFGTCPHCKYDVNRIWNLKFCGTCGGPISWEDLIIKDWND